MSWNSSERTEVVTIPGPAAVGLRVLVNMLDGDPELVLVGAWFLPDPAYALQVVLARVEGQR